ncbi:MAG: gas vesicle protein GvpD P-loop domain-containing protein [Candidatus Thermoplasmatota archaeon]
MRSKRGTAQGQIPQQILDFFESPGGHSLLVKGDAGTGKTTFALQLIEELSGIEATHYISGRVTDRSLYNQFPWLAKKVRRNDLIAGGRGFLNALHPGGRKGTCQARLPEAVKQEAKSLLKVLRGTETMPVAVDRSGLRKLEGQIIEGEADVTAEGDRGDLVNGVLTLDLSSDLPEIEWAYDVVERALPKKSLIVFDSINSLSEKYGVAQVRLVNTIQRDLVENSGANLVYILEEAEKSQLDYLGDGVIRLHSQYHKGRRLRVLTIEKLRGCPITEPTVCYTLLDGRMSVFECPRYSIGDPGSGEGKPRHFKPIPDLSGDIVSTGSADIDFLIGGLAHGSVGVFEFADNVSPSIVSNLCYTMVANFVSQERGVCILPPRHGTGHTAYQMLSSQIGEERFYERVRVFEPTTCLSKDILKNTILLEGTNVETDFRWEGIEYALSGSQQPFVILLSLDTLSKMYDERVEGSLIPLIYAVRKVGAIFIGFTSEPDTERLIMSTARIHVKVERLGDQTFLYGEKPYTGLHALIIEDPSALGRLSLVPVV